VLELLTIRETLMSRSGKVSVGLTRHQLSQIRRVVDAGEFSSTAAVVREAVGAWLQRRTLHAGRLGAARLTRTLQARQEAAPGEPFERVELMFDAGDAKA
jgi:Arc/MetJ-type ribon-helix-helix transcriptional regulator